MLQQQGSSSPPVSNSSETGAAPSRSGAIALTAGGLLFLIGTVVHPARDGYGIAAAGRLYAVTHSIQAIGLLLVALGFVAVIDGASQGRRAWYAALIGTLAWFGLLVFDGSHNPVAAAHTPAVVHTSGDLDPGGLMIVFPALILFPLGYAILARVRPLRTATVLLGLGGVVYAVGGLLLFVLGPHSMVVQIVEVCGAAPYALGCLLLARTIWSRQWIIQ